MMLRQDGKTNEETKVMQQLYKPQKRQGLLQQVLDTHMRQMDATCPKKMRKNRATFLNADKYMSWPIDKKHLNNSHIPAANLMQ